MNLTIPQKKAILFILLFFAGAIAYHYAERLLHPLEPFDFTAFEEQFKQQYAAIQAQSQESTPGELPLMENSALPAKNSSNLQDSLININEASPEELTVLPRIGPKTAAKIVAYRETHGRFAAKKELMKVSGIGVKTYENLKNLITVGNHY